MFLKAVWLAIFVPALCCARPQPQAADLYERLGVGPNVARDVIVDAYIDAMNSSLSDAEKAQVTEAFEVLRSDQRRRIYDRRDRVPAAYRMFRSRFDQRWQSLNLEEFVGHLATAEGRKILSQLSKSQAASRQFLEDIGEIINNTYEFHPEDYRGLYTSFIELQVELLPLFNSPEALLDERGQKQARRLYELYLELGEETIGQLSKQDWQAHIANRRSLNPPPPAAISVRKAAFVAAAVACASLAKVLIGF